jgi:hypothetical protein
MSLLDSEILMKPTNLLDDPNLDSLCSRIESQVEVLKKIETLVLSLQTLNKNTISVLNDYEITRGSSSSKFPEKLFLIANRHINGAKSSCESGLASSEMICDDLIERYVTLHQEIVYTPELERLKKYNFEAVRLESISSGPEQRFRFYDNYFDFVIQSHQSY